jgi:hypothetical protein
MGPLDAYTRQLVELTRQTLTAPPFGLPDRDAVPLAVYLITGGHESWNKTMLMLVKLTPTASVLTHVLRKWYPHPHSIYKTSNYRNWLRNAKPVDLKYPCTPQHSVQPRSDGLGRRY